MSETPTTDALLLLPQDWDRLALHAFALEKLATRLRKDARRYRWMRDHDMTAEYVEYITGNLNGRAVDPLDGTIDAAIDETNCAG